ncbi:MAG: hypothetical protein GXO16_08485, partial [Epsilonproteobacteria bacterium]|nr:hypothetical protein [Campylobacterota bacterium]
PSAKSDELIELSKKAFVKLQTFHSTLGEDNPIFTNEEEVGSMKLFNDALGDEVDEELGFLEEIRSFKEKDPQKYRELAKLPSKLRVQRNDDPSLHDVTAVFIKNEEAKSFYKVSADAVDKINFLEMAKLLKADPKVKPITPLKKSHYDQVNLALEAYERELDELSLVTSVQKVTNATDKKAIRLLKEWRKKGFIDPDVAKHLIRLIELGRYQNLGKEIAKISQKGPNINHEVQELIERYSLDSDGVKAQAAIPRAPQIILSETYL